MFFGLDPDFTSWGPFINHDTYIIQPVTRSDFITAIVAFIVVGGFATSAAYVGYKQTIRSREPWKSAYIWMIWLEWASCIGLAIECLLFLLRVVRPSFYFFMSILFLWVIQTQCLLQIIINRIRIILHDRKKGQQLMIWTFIIMAAINVSVFCIWIPARLQMSTNWIHINEIYDRVEKVLYLIIDGYLNFYFIRTVKQNLVANGLQKYNKLVRFNQGMIVVSLLMDIVILGTMSLPNGFVYAMFHPLAYLVKLNIEMSMARLIKKIALGSNNPQDGAGFRSFNDSSKPNSTPVDNGSFKSWVAHQGASIKGMFSEDKGHTAGIGGIKKTEEFTVRSAPGTAIELESRKGSAEKGVHVAVSCVATPESRTESAVKNLKEGKASRAKSSDEETLIEPHPRAVYRRSADSSSPPSELSDFR